MNPIQKDTRDASGFVLLADFVPGIIQEIRYYSTYNFIGERIMISLPNDRFGSE